MKKITALTLLLIASMLLIIRCSTNSSSDKYSASQDCNCDTVPLPPHQQITNPKDDSTSNFWLLRENTNNCMFHQFSVQKFLWLTRKVSSGHAYFQDSLQQVNVNLQPINRNSRYPKINLILKDTAQAATSGSLYSNPALSQDGKSHMVYYSKFVNTTLLKACKSFADSLSQSDSVKKRTYNEFSFPNGSLELKVSWISQKAIPVKERNKYYRTEAVVGLDTLTAKLDTVALLGIHVVTKVINHPEFIWATFEHNELGAYYNWAKSTPTKEDSITSNKDLLFFAKGSTYDKAGITWSNDSPKVRPTPFKAFSVFKYGTPRTNGNLFMPHTSQSKNNGDKTNYANVEAVNKSLEGYFAKQPDVWKNYFYNGAIWLNMDGKDSVQQAKLIYKNIHYKLFIEIDTTSDARGSLACKNITMETYTQAFDTVSNKPTLNNLYASSNVIGNCFGCHTGRTQPSKFDTTTGISPLYFSHLFNHYLRYTETQKDSEAEAKKTDSKGFNSARRKK